MPIYEYRCGSCNKEFEELVTKDGQVVTCPACGSEKTEKLLSCCKFRSGDPGVHRMAMPRPSSGGGCSGCSGGNCSTCSG